MPHGSLFIFIRQLYRNEQPLPKKKIDPLEKTIERAMLPDQYIGYQYGAEFAGSLERVKSQIDALIASGEAERAVNLYESMIARMLRKS